MSLNLKVDVMKLGLLITLLAVVVGYSSVPHAAEYILSVDGLGCPFCAYGIEKRLRTLKGVQAVRVDIEKGQVVVVTRDPDRLTKDQLGAKVKEAGFTLRSLRLAPENEKVP